MNQKRKAGITEYTVLLFLAVSFLYILFVIQPFLYTHHAQSPFLFTQAFFKGFLQFPGEPAEYIASFFMQFFHSPLAGTLAFALISGLQYLLTFLLLKNISKSRFVSVFSLIPFVFSIALVNNYNVPYSIEVSVLLILTVLLIITRFSKGILSMILTYIPGSLLIYYIAGSGYFLLFSITAALISFKLKIRKRLIFLLFLATFSFALPYVAAHFVFALPPKQQFFYFFPTKAFFMKYQPTVVFAAFLLSIPFLILIGLILKQYEIKNHQHILQKNTIIQNTLALLLITGFAVFSHFLSFQPDEKKKAAADFYCYTNNPEKTATNAKSLKEYNFKANVNYNLVMCKTGQLTEKAFDFLQITGSDAIHPDVEFQADMSFVAADFYYDLGFITEARHWAYETLVFYPYNRRTMQLLVKIHLITREYSVARQYLNLLKSGFGSKNFVREFEPVVLDTTLFGNYPELKEKRSFIPPDNELSPSIEERLKQLLTANPQNKKAFELLMLYYLLESDAEKFTEFYKNTTQYFSKVPEVYEEALLVFNNLDNLTADHQIEISEAAKTRFSNFKKIREQYKNSTRMARNMLYKDFGGSYFYFREFVYPNVIKPDIIDDDSDYPAI